MTRSGRAAAALLLFGLATAPPSRGLLESSMPGHVLVQLPLLVLGGYCGAAAFPGRWRETLQTFNRGGLPGILLVLLAAAFWMLPRSLDAALDEPVMAAAKCVSLPLLVGLPLALSLPRLHPIAGGFVLANLLSMLGVLGWLYRQAPVRLCSYYRLDEQVWVGNGLLLVAGLVGLGWVGRAVFGSRR